MSKLTVSKGAGAQVSLGGHAASFKTYGNPIPYIAPWVVALLMLALAAGVRLLLARDVYAWYWSVATAAMYTTLTFLAWRASRARGKLTCGLATVGIGLGGAWSWYAAGVDNFTWRPLVAYVLGMIVICGGANFLVALREGQPGGPSMHDRMRKAVEDIRNLEGIRVVDGTVVAEVEMEPGATVADLQAHADELASGWGAPKGAVRVLEGGPDAPAVAGQVRVMPVNRIATPPPWPGPSRREGGSIMDPITVGVRASGEPLQFWLPGDRTAGRSAAMIQVTGMSGAGKSEFIAYTVVELLSRGGPAEVEYWYGNSRKSAQEPDWLRNGAARSADNRRDVIAMLKDLRAEAPERAAALGAAGLKEWAPGAPVPFRLAIVDEFADIAADATRLITDLSETLRSLGVVLMVGLQRATGDRWPTSARSNFGAHVCFGVRDETDASMALPEEIIEAGAAPWIWGISQPGSCYLTAPGVPRDLWTTEARTFRPNEQLQRRWAEHFIGRRAAGAVVSAAPPPPVARVDVDPVQWDSDEDVPADVEPGEVEDIITDVLNDPDDDDELGEADLEDQDEEEEERPRIPADVQGELGDADHTRPIGGGSGGGGMELALSPRMSAEQAQQYLRATLEGLRDQGITRVKLEDFGADVLAATGMKASWLSKWCGRLADPDDPSRLMDKLDERGCYELRARAALPAGSRP